MFSTTPSLGRSNSTKYCTHFVQKVCSTLLDAKSLDWDHEGSKQQPPPSPPPPAPPGGMVDYKDISRSPPGMSKPLFIVNDWINRQAQLAIYLYLYLYFYVYICVYIYILYTAGFLSLKKSTLRYEFQAFHADPLCRTVYQLCRAYILFMSTPKGSFLRIKKLGGRKRQMQRTMRGKFGKFHCPHRCWWFTKAQWTIAYGKLGR